MKSLKFSSKKFDSFDFDLDGLTIRVNGVHYSPAWKGSKNPDSPRFGPDEDAECEWDEMLFVLTDENGNEVTALVPECCVEPISKALDLDSKLVERSEDYFQSQYEDYLEQQEEARQEARDRRYQDRF